VVTVDDGSADASKNVLEELKKKCPITILAHETNQGPGVAFRTGFNHVLSVAGASDFIITMDADNTHSTKTVGMIVAGLKEGYEMVIASVFAPGGMMIGVPFLRYVLTLGCNFLYRILFPVRGIREYTGFYRGYRVDALRTARERLGGELMTVPGFASMAELLVRLRTVPIFMKEVPMIVRYDQKGGKSKLRIGRTIREHLVVIGGNMFRRRVIG
jgi:dolichol-phosphate mannosyltransferase